MSYDGWEPDDAVPHVCRTADGQPITVGMWVIDYDRKLSQVTGQPDGYQMTDSVCWSCAGHHGHWWDTTTGSFDGSRLTTRGVEKAKADAGIKPKYFTVRVSNDSHAMEWANYFRVPMDKKDELVAWLRDNKAERE